MFTQQLHHANRRSRTLVALAAVPLLIGMLAACSSAPEESKKSGGASQSLTDEQAFEAWNLKYRACMSEKGIDVGDDPNAAMTTDDPDFETIAQECLKEVGDPPGGASQEKSSKDIADGGLKFAECLRGRGYDVPDPQGEGLIAVPDGVSESDRLECSAEAGLG